MDRPRVELVIFDCDGVLVDSEGPAALAFAEVLQGYGCTAELDALVARVERDLRGRSLKDCMPMVAAWLDREVPSDFLTRLDTRTFERFATDLRPMPGAAAAILHVQARGLKTAVASNGRLTKMRTTLGQTGLLPLLEPNLFSSEQVSEAKPSPDLFLLAARSLGVQPPNCLVVEDSRFGLLAAERAQMPALFLDPTAAVHGSRSDRTIQSLDQLQSWL
jgi:HAD superfamily hydrolase (TIGR01509 family)